ncbi:unnamed protein product [Taenia asiatica]|uniref:TACC_C domain-containing protein n=1 Tax=Taenia asiatica TaxID=60517 RepID=A0A0R3W1G9_TAEAS|nr:unnamed protein product [Taenia asiatica]
MILRDAVFEPPCLPVESLDHCMNFSQRFIKLKRKVLNLNKKYAMNFKLALAQSQVNIALAKKKALVEALTKLEADCAAKVRERDQLREQYNAKHNAYCELVESLATTYQSKVRSAPFF